MTYAQRLLATAGISILAGSVVTSLLLIARDVDRLADRPVQPVPTVTVTTPPTLLPDEEDGLPL